MLSVIGRAGPDTHRMLTNGARATDHAGSFPGDGSDRRTIGREFSAISTGHFAGRVYALFGVARALGEDEMRELVAHQAGQAGVGV